jgi:hypothetical protein
MSDRELPSVLPVECAVVRIGGLVLGQPQDLGIASNESPHVQIVEEVMILQAVLLELGNDMRINLGYCLNVIQRDLFFDANGSEIVLE